MRMPMYAITVQKMPVQEVDHNYDSLNHHLHPFYQPDPTTHQFASQNGFDDDSDNAASQQPPSMSSPPLPLLPATTYSPPRASRQKHLSLTTNLVDQAPNNVRDELSPDPREFYLQYRDPFGSDGAGPDDVDMNTASYSRRSSARSNGSSNAQRYRSSSRAHQFRSSPASHSKDYSPQKPRRAPVSPSATRSRQSSLKELVDRFNQATDEVLPRPPNRPSFTSSRAESPSSAPKTYTRSGQSSSHRPTTIESHSSIRYNQPSANSATSTKQSGHKTRTPQNTVRKPLFGEILPLDTFAGHQERRRASHQRRGSDSCMHSPGPMFLDIPLEISTGWSPTSPTAWYLGYNPSIDSANTTKPQLLHRRSRSELGNCSQPMSPTSFNPNMGVKSPISPTSPSSSRRKSGSQSRIPVATRRFSHASDSGNSSPSTRTSSAMDRHPVNISLPPKGISALPKPSPKLNPSPKFHSPSNSPASPRITSPGRHAHNIQPLKSPTLKAIITAPPPKKSPPLRSSRPRQPVSTATTTASRGKVVDRVSDFQNNAMFSKSPRTSRARSRRLPELGNVDFAARRQRIQQAFNKSIEESNKKEIARKAQRAARIKEAEKKDDQRNNESQVTEELVTTIAEKASVESRVPTVESSDIGEEHEAFLTPDEGRSPNSTDAAENVGPAGDLNVVLTEKQLPITDTYDAPQQRLTDARPSSACSDTAPQSAVTALTDTTPIDMEPQTELPQPLQSHRSMLSHIMQMRESSPDITDSSDDDEDTSSSGRDKESIQIMLRQTYFDPIDTSSETQEFAEDPDGTKGHGDRQRWSMSSWSSSIQIQNNQLIEGSMSEEAKVETFADDDRTAQSTCDSDRNVTPQPPPHEPGPEEAAETTQDTKPKEATDDGSTQQTRPGERFSLNLMHRYPDLAKQARWDTKRATQLYLQELAKAGFGQPRIPEPIVKKTETEKKRLSGHSNEAPQEDGLVEDAVILPESKSIPPSDYVQHLANLNQRDDWERASPSIADWMHLAATDKDVAEEHRDVDKDHASTVLGRDDAKTPKISTSGPNISAPAAGGNGLGVSIQVHSPQDGDSPTIPELPNYPPPPPPPGSLSQHHSTEQLQQPPLAQPSPSVYSQPSPPQTLPSTTFVPKDYELEARDSNDSWLHHTGATPSPQTVASSVTSQDRQPAPQEKVEAPSPKASPTPEQRRLRKRFLVIKELVDTEYTFGQDMTVVVDIYKGTSSSCGLTPEDVKTLFGNSEQVVKFSIDFQDALKQAARSVYVLPKSQRWLSKRGSRYVPNTNNQESQPISDDEKDRRTTIGQAFMELIGRMEKVYSEYLKNHDAANKTLDLLLKNKNKHVSIWLKECRDWASDLTTAWNLDSLLVKPVQRVLKYPLLLTELLSATPADHPDHAAIANALRETTAMSVRINDMKKRADVVGQVVSSRKRKESDVRAGLSKAFGRRTEKLKQHVGLSEIFTDKDYDILAQKFGENFFQLQLIMRDVELYTTEMQNSMTKLNEFIIAIEAYMTVAPSNYPELESKWCRFRLAVKDIMTVALVDHLASVRKSVINPMVTLLKLHDGPQRVMQKRNKRLLDYVKYKAVKDRGDRPDKKTTELGEQFIALNVTLKEELPRLLSLTGKLMETCLNNFVQIQTVWNMMMQKRLGYTIDRMPQDVGQIISDWSGDFTFSEAQVLSLGVCNGTVLADSANVQNFSTPSTSHGVDTSSSRRPSSTTTRTFSVEHGSSPKVSVEFGSNPPVSFMQSSSHGESLMHHANGSHAHIGGRSRTNSNFSGTHVPSMTTVVSPQTRNSTTPSTGATSNSSYRTSDASPLLPQLSLDTPRFPEFFSDPTTSGNNSQSNANRPGAPDLAEHPSSPDAPRYSGFFSSAMPMAEPSVPSTPPDSQLGPKEPKVLFLAASMFEFNIDRARREAGYPYLTYVAGEIFDVIGEKGDLWLARNQDDPTHQT
ncbi:hypothetical protein DIZ76_014918 [Coccidioides immitis]|nr:hypothetical protein DIZ76_014918 [Coccidioides immitis]